GVKVERDLAAQQPRLALYVVKQPNIGTRRYQRIGAGGVQHPPREDVIADAVFKGIDAEAHVVAHVAHASIDLQAGFGLKAGLPHLVADGALVHAIRAQLGNVGRPETARQVGLHREAVAEAVGGT
nr:hypothetical protein [Tanacetum cinerariifolium]